MPLVHIRRWFLLLWLPLLACTAPIDILTPATPAPAESTDEAAGEAIDVGRVSQSIESASQALESQFQGFLEREPLGFAPQLMNNVGSDLWSWTTIWRQASERFETQSVLENLSGFLPALIILAFVILYTLLSHQSRSLTFQLQARQYSRVSALGTGVLRSSVLLFGEMLPIALCVFLSYFPVRAIFGEQIWTLLLTNTLWLLFGWRVVQWAIETTFGLFFLHVPDEHANILRAWADNGARLLVFFVLSITVFDAFRYRPEMIALLWFSTKCVFALLPMILMRKRDSVIAMFPENTDSNGYAFLRQMFERYFTAFLSLTIVLLTMRAFGYARASTFILTRGYGIFFLLIGSFLGLARGRRMMDARIARLEQNDPQRELLESIRQLLTFAALIVIGVVVLHLTTIYEPALILLKIPLITLQSIEFSIFNVISAALIIGSAALLSKLLRAVLNDRVYPSLHVDVGVAYAMNTLLNYAIVVIGFFAVLIALGVNLSALTVVVASLSVGIGFGLQNITENLISGFIILFGRAVRKGDFVTVGTVYGRVEAVGARAVVVRTMDNYDMLIPSKELVGGTIINWTYRDTIIRQHLSVGVSYNADPREVESVLLDAASRHPMILPEPKPEVWFVNFNDSSIDFELLIYFDCMTTNADRLRGQLYYHIWDALKEANIEIPFPQRDLHIRDIGALTRALPSAQDPDES